MVVIPSVLWAPDKDSLPDIVFYNLMSYQFVPVDICWNVSVKEEYRLGFIKHCVLKPLVADCKIIEFCPLVGPQSISHQNLYKEIIE